jgi:hypothetical protein
VFVTRLQAGKSTYLRQICQLQMMAQSGFHVPADYASFRVIDHLFTRITFNDNLAENLSGFAVEVNPRVSTCPMSLADGGYRLYPRESHRFLLGRHRRVGTQ